MFEINEDTRINAVEAMKTIIESNGGVAPDDSVLGEAFDAAVEIVKKQFGLR